MSLQDYEDSLTKVSFVLESPDLDPAAVTAALGIHPTKAWQRGESRLPSRPELTYTFGLWEYRLLCPPTTPFEEQLCAVLDVFEPLTDRLTPLIAQYTAGISVWSKFGMYQVGFHVDEWTMQRLAALHLSLDIDLHPLVDDPDERMDTEEIPPQSGVGA